MPTQTAIRRLRSQTIRFLTLATLLCSRLQERMRQVPFTSTIMIFRDQGQLGIRLAARSIKMDYTFLARRVPVWTTSISTTTTSTEIGGNVLRDGFLSREDQELQLTCVAVLGTTMSEL